jgi:aryl-alcohol dehydrogenase
VRALALGTEASFDVTGVMTTGKRIIGIIEGDSVPDLFIPSLVELYQQGRLPFGKLAKFCSLDQINQTSGPAVDQSKVNENAGSQRHVAPGKPGIRI